MILLNLEHIKKDYTEKTLLEDVSLGISEGDKIGLVGVNGSGKSTLLGIAAGVIEPDSGTITANRELRTGYLPQNPAYDENLTVMEQAALYTGNAPEYVIRTYLNKTGITDHDIKMGKLSGGQRKRVALACVMLKDTNLLILDEPTNHMDSSIIEWMEQQLSEYQGAVLMITHDRYFLERITDRICEIEKGKLVSYQGSYDSYLEQKAARLEMAKATERKRAAIYRKELRWIRWSAPARTTKAKGRIQRFEKLQEGKQEFDDPRLEIGTISSRLGKKIIEIENISKSYGDKKLIDGFSYTVLRNDRIGIVGDNGCGKTTLLRIIMGEEQPDSGTVTTGETVRTGYFSQESEPLDDSLRVIKYIEGIAQNVRTEDGYLSASQMLERFLFPSYMHSVEIGRLSGGEKRRLYLLGILMQAPNVLILDEPTNDLDIQTLTVLEDYLDDFPGAVIIVSHDRYFLDRLAIRTFAFEEGGHIGHYTGGYSKYMNEKEAAFEELKKASSGAGGGNDTRKTGKRLKKLKFTYKEQKEYETIDADIEKIEQEISDVENLMLECGSDYEKIKELAEKKQTLDDQLTEKMDRWEYLSELAQRIEQGEMIEVEA